MFIYIILEFYGGDVKEAFHAMAKRHLVTIDNDQQLERPHHTPSIRNKPPSHFVTLSIMS